MLKSIADKNATLVALTAQVACKFSKSTATGNYALLMSEFAKIKDAKIILQVKF